MTARRLTSDRETRSDKGARRSFGVGSKLRAFFEANPDEELTEQQAADKFDVNLAAVQFAVRELSRDGLLERVTVIRPIAPRCAS